MYCAVIVKLFLVRQCNVMMPKRKTGVNKTRGYLALYDENYEAIKEHIVSHYAEKVLSTRRNELLMYIDDSGCATFKSSEAILVTRLFMMTTSYFL